MSQLVLQMQMCNVLPARPARPQRSQQRRLPRAPASAVCRQRRVCARAAPRPATQSRRTRGRRAGPPRASAAPTHNLTPCPFVLRVAVLPASRPATMLPGLLDLQVPGRHCRPRQQQPYLECLDPELIRWAKATEIEVGVAASAPLAPAGAPCCRGGRRRPARRARPGTSSRCRPPGTGSSRCPAAQLTPFEQELHVCGQAQQRFF